MNALGIMIDSWGTKNQADVACEKIAKAEAAAKELEKAQAALTAAQAVAEAAKAEAEKAVHNLPPVKPVADEQEGTAVSSPAATVETEDERIARIVESLLSRKAAEANTAATTITVTEVQVEKPAEELTLSAVPVAGPTAARGGNYPAAKQNKNRR